MADAASSMSVASPLLVELNRVVMQPPVKTVYEVVGVERPGSVRS